MIELTFFCSNRTEGIFLKLIEVIKPTKGFKGFSYKHWDLGEIKKTFV